MSVVRVAAHLHTTWSYDGSWSLPDLAHALRRRGFDAMLTAEHDRTFDAARWEEYRRACARHSSASLLVVPGIEYSDPDNTVHVLVWGAETFLGAGRPTAGLLRDARAAGGVAVLAHPSRRDAWRRLDDEAVALLHGVEAWNRKYDGWAPSPHGCRLAREASLLPFVGLDFHTARQFAPLAMSLEIGTGPARPAAICAALAAGRARPRVARMALGRLTDGRGLEATRAAETARKRARAGQRRLLRTR